MDDLGVAAGPRRRSLKRIFGIAVTAPHISLAKRGGVAVTVTVDQTTVTILSCGW